MKRNNGLLRMIYLVTLVSFFLAQPKLALGDGLLRAGIIGCDTSHAIAFTKAFQGAEAGTRLAEVQVVAAFPGGSDDIPKSRDRVGPFTAELRSMGVEIVDSIDSLLERVDVVLLESVDGRKHLAQVRPVFAARKPVFIDKPIGGSLADAVEIFELAKASGTAVFSSSAVRFAPDCRELRDGRPIGDIVGCMAFSPCKLEPHHPDLFWYGVHGVELLFTLMGPDCLQVTRTTTESTDLVTGVWADGRIGTFRGTRTGVHDFGAVAFGSQSNRYFHGFAGYDPLLGQIVQFFKTGTPPVSAAETLAIFAFMEAAQESQRQGGRAVTLESVLAKAHAEIAARR